MVLPIEKYGSEKLRVPARKVAVSTELAVLAEDMLETMYKAKGVGLAAEQVGRDEALCVIDVPLSCEDDEETKTFNAGIEQPLVMFNPEIVSFSGEQTGREGCLSLPNVGGDVTRPFEVTVQFLDLKGVPQIVTARGFLARAVCHETDHLKGIVYIDHMDEKSREKVLKKLQKKKSK
jgi:peptide deformylase